MTKAPQIWTSDSRSHAIDPTLGRGGATNAQEVARYWSLADKGNLPKLAIVIPCYNYEKYVERAIRSVVSHHEYFEGDRIIFSKLLMKDRKKPDKFLLPHGMPSDEC